MMRWNSRITAGIEVRAGLQQSGSRALDRGQRRAQLVAHHAEELRAQAFELLDRRQILHGDDDRRDSTVLGPDRRRVDQHRGVAPVRRREPDFLAAYRLGALQRAGQRGPGQIDLAAVGAPDNDDLQHLLRRVAGRAKPLDDALALLVDREHVAGRGIEDHHADRRGLDQGMEVGPRAFGLAVPGDIVGGSCRAQGDLSQERLVVLGKRRRLVGEKQVSGVGAAVTNRHSQKGPGESPLRCQAKGVCVGSHVREPQRSANLVEMFEEVRTAGPRRESGALLFREARGHEPMRLPASPQGRGAIAGAGQRARLLQRLCEQDIEAGTLAGARRPALLRLFVGAAQ